MLRKRRRSAEGGADTLKRRASVAPVVKAEGKGARGAAPACELGTDPNVATAKPEELRPAAPAASGGKEVLNDDEPSPFPKFARPLPEERCDGASPAAPPLRPLRSTSPAAPRVRVQ